MSFQCCKNCFEGQETTANLLAYMVMCIGQHPDVIDR